MMPSFNEPPPWDSKSVYKFVKNITYRCVSQGQHRLTSHIRSTIIAMVVLSLAAGHFLFLPTLNQLIFGGLSIVILILWGSGSLYARRRRMPPGPKGLPFVGNKHQVPSIKPWRMFKKWNEQYGMEGLQL